MSKGFLVFFALIFLACAGPNDYFTEQDTKQAESLILSKFDKTTGAFNKNLKDTYFAVDALKKLGIAVQAKAAVCKFAKEALATDKIETIFYSVFITETLGCGAQASDNVINEITNALGADRLYDQVFAVGSIAALRQGKHIDIDNSEVLPAVSTIIDLMDTEYGTWFLEENQEEGSAYLAGLALTALSQLVSDLKEQADLSTVISSIPALMDNGDDNDESRLFFRHSDNSISSLKTTAFLIKGLADLIEATGEATGVTDEQVDLIAAFLISQKYVSSIEDVHALVVGLTAVNSKGFKRPLVISLKNTQIHATKEKDRDTEIKVVVTDIWGKYTGTTRVFLIRAYQSGKEDMALLSNQEVPLVAGQKNVYSLDFLAARPDPGAYVLEFRVIPQEKHDEYQAITSAQRRIQVVAAVSLSDGSISIADNADRDLHGKETSFEQGKTIKQELQLKSHQHVYISFKLRNVASGRSVLAHQTFVKVTNTANKTSVYYVVPHSGQAYDLHWSVNKLAPKFNYVSGLYEIEILVGDSFISSSFRWVVAKVNVTFDGKAAVTHEVVDPFTPRPVIEHKFRAAASRAPEYMTNIFTVLVLLPAVLLIVGIFKVGGNLSNFPSNGLIPIYTLLFVASIGSLLGLIVLYWFRLKVFTALGYGFAIGVPTIFFGNQVLHYYAHQRALLVKKIKTQ